MRLTVLLIALSLSLPIAVACSDKVIPPPAGDQNFDDPDEPGQPGQVGAVDAATADAQVPCASNVDCPPRAAICMFPIADGCSAKGQCVNYEAPTGCAKTLFCDCSGGGVAACAPAGMSPVAVSPDATCVVPDAAAPADSGPGDAGLEDGGRSDAALDAPTDG